MLFLTINFFNIIGTDSIFQFWYTSPLAKFFTKDFAGISSTVCIDNYDSISSSTLTFTSSICSVFTFQSTSVEVCYLQYFIVRSDHLSKFWEGCLEWQDNKFFLFWFSPFNLCHSCSPIDLGDPLIVIFLGFISKSKSLVNIF